MQSNEGTVYMIREQESGDGWARPEPAADVILGTVAERTSLSTDDLDDLASYVDPEDLTAVLEADPDGALAFSVEGHEVVVTGSGDVSVDGT